MKPGWTVIMQIQQRGKWIDPPLPDPHRTWFPTRSRARTFHRALRESCPGMRFVLRRAER